MTEYPEESDRFGAMEVSDRLSKDAELARLRAEKQAIHEDLIQCQADKEFVWSLWKRLQVANPDITQAISLVLQREKEKNELKDKKVLEILHIKDDRIAELDKILIQQRGDTKMAMQRSEELQSTNDRLGGELQVKTQEVESLAQKKEELSRELQNKVSEEVDTVDKIKQENRRLLEENKKLSNALEKHKEELVMIEEKNAMLMDKIKEMEKDIHGIGISAEVAAKEHTIANVQLGQAEKDMDQWRHRARTAEGELNKLRNKHVELKQSYQETTEHTSQQLKVITQLQKLQAETQSMLKNQENAHLIEASNYQQMNKELQKRYEAVKNSEESLQNLFAEKAKVTTTCEAGVQVRVPEEPSKVKGQTEVEEPWVERYESFHAEIPLPDDPKRVGASQNQVLNDKESFGSKVERLQKLMLVKDEELAQMRQAHQGRLGRLRSLQSAYNILREQIETYEEHEKDATKPDRAIPRSAPKALQKQNSDAVWNELTYYKQRTADLIQEKMQLQEEFDHLRVREAADARALEELTQCLEENKSELSSQMRRYKELKKNEEVERKKARTLNSENSQLKTALSDLEVRESKMKQNLADADKNVRSLRAECSRFESQAAANKSQADTLQIKVNRLKMSLIRMRKKNRSLVAERDETGSRSRRELDEKLSQTLDRMSRILPDDFNDTDSQSSADLTPPLRDRLSPQMVTSTPRINRTVRRTRVRSNTWTGTTSRQLLSVQRHLTRMARAYEDDQAGETIWKQVSTQTDFNLTDVGITPKKLMHAGVGNLDINDETSTNTSEDTQSHVVLISRGIGTGGKVTYTPKPLLQRIQASPGRKAKVRNLQKRVGTLQQQVTILKEMKATLQKNQTDLKMRNQKLEEDLTLASHQLQSSRQTVQRLSRDLEISRTESVMLKEQFIELQSQKQEEQKQATSTKQMEERLKTQSHEMGRQSDQIKSLKEKDQEQTSKMKTLQEKVRKLDKDSSQKRSLIEDLRAKTRASEHDKQSLEERLESGTSRASKLREDVGCKKVEVDSLRKQLAVARKERERCEERCVEIRRDVDKQKSLVELSRSRQEETERSLTQLEALADQQLRSLTQQSEDALKTARKELKALRSREAEYKRAIRSLALEVFKETSQPFQHPPPITDSDPLSAKEQSLASSILNLSAEDWQGFIGSEEQEQQDPQVDEELTEDLEKLDRTLESKNFNSDMVLELFRSSFIQRSR